MSLSTRTWTKIRKLYEDGAPPSYISSIHDVSVSQIWRRIKKENWEKPIEMKPSSITDAAFQKAAEVLERAEVLEIENTEKESETVFELRKKARAVQSELLDLILEAKIAMSAFIKAHPDGRYIKKDDEKGTTYGLISEIFSPMAALLNASDVITQIQRPINLTTNTQINQNNSQLGDQVSSTTPPITIEFLPVEASQ